MTNITLTTHSVVSVFLFYFQFDPVSPKQIFAKNSAATAKEKGYDERRRKTTLNKRYFSQ